SRGNFSGAGSSSFQDHRSSGWDHYLRHRRFTCCRRLLLPAADSHCAGLCVLYVIRPVFLWRALCQIGGAAVAATNSTSANFPNSRYATCPAKAVGVRNVFRAEGPQRVSSRCTPCRRPVSSPILLTSCLPTADHFPASQSSRRAYE